MTGRHKSTPRRSGKRKSLERASAIDEEDKRAVVEVDSGVFSIESLPDSVLLLILEKTKDAVGKAYWCSVSALNKRFIKSVASVNKRFHRLSRSAFLWKPSDVSSKGCLVWLIKHLDLSSICSKGTVSLSYLEEFSPRELAASFGKLGPYLKDVEITPPERPLEGYEKIYDFYAVPIMKSCPTLTRLCINVPNIHMNTLINCVEHLPLLTDLAACRVSIYSSSSLSVENRGNLYGITLLINALSEGCPGLTSLAISPEFWTARNYIGLFPELHKITGLMSLKLSEGELHTKFFNQALSSLTSLDLSKTRIPETLLIADNSLLRCLKLQSLSQRSMEHDFTIGIKRCTELQRVVVSRIARDVISEPKVDDVALQLTTCPRLTSLSVMHLWDEVRFEDCPSLTELVVVGQAFSADIHRLSYLTHLTVAFLNGPRNDWPMQVFLNGLQCLNTLESLSIMHHKVNEMEVTVSSPCMRVFSMEYIDDGFKLQKLHMHCPKLEQLTLTDDEYRNSESEPESDDWDEGESAWPRDEYGIQEEDRGDSEEYDEDGFELDPRGALQCLDLSACAYLRNISVSRRLIHALSLEW
eukprot:CAMPEP_0184339652 /NCGR_PEP_ID=MMETSP1089-20130417/8332_1 /TAXON_ID=38269 ORGANISM="Gloeochaete wittrockiana, Strain SAG46.84" /NCGR_SAMPLE_ID=MMETSP1089 /ASSEMBLY_ACC=CAM_ASM_000445 /LENGTH=583 /DNA_ID=CAMNT_0026667027 /DNA_START=130 /DNA_END=1878 /DNA_ORIENTATION=-